MDTCSYTPTTPLRTFFEQFEKRGKSSLYRRKIGKNWMFLDDSTNMNVGDLFSNTGFVAVVKYKHRKKFEEKYIKRYDSEPAAGDLWSNLG